MRQEEKTPQICRKHGQTDIVANSHRSRCPSCPSPPSPQLIDGIYGAGCDTANAGFAFQCSRAFSVTHSRTHTITLTPEFVAVIPGGAAAYTPHCVYHSVSRARTSTGWLAG